MKTRDKIIISVVVGLIALSYTTTPLWWGVLFSPLTQQLATTPLTDTLSTGFCWQTDSVVLRLRGLDWLLELLGQLP